MNGLLMIGIAIVVLVTAYALYGRYLANKWGIDINAKTPAYTHEDGVDYVPTPKAVAFAHQFSSIAGAGPVTGPIMAAVFGWVPVLLWLLVGGVFFGAVTDFGAMYASVKNEGKSMGFLIEQYIGKVGKKVFSLFAWLFTLLVIAAFADIVANTFNGFTKTGEKIAPNAAAASISMLFMVGAVILGLYVKNRKPNGKQQFIVGLILFVGMLALGMVLPIYAGKNTWLIVIAVYLFLASITPMWLLMQPRDYLSTFLLIGMIVGAVLGIIVANPTINLNAFNGFTIQTATGAKSSLFPTLFITIACGAVSGFHSLVSSGTSSKTVSNEKDMLCISYGAMLVETLLGVVALVVAGSVAVGGALPEGTPFAIFSSSVAGFLEMFGIPNYVANCFMTMCVSALALTSLDSVARIGRMSFQELFLDGDEKAEDMSTFKKIVTNKYFATIITLTLGFILCMGGYNNVWPLFGAANQLLSGLVLITLVVFLRVTGRKGFMLYGPMTIMFVVTFTALTQSTINLFRKLQGGNFIFLVDGLQLIMAIALIVLGLIVVVSCIKKISEKPINSDNARIGA